MITPAYKKMKKNGTTLYVFPSVEEDKNFENQNDNYNMYLSHYVLVKFPRQTQDVLNFDNTFKQNGSSIAPSSFKDQLVESLRNYVANHEAVVKNSKINSTEFYYDPLELENNTEKIFWKWCKELGIVDFEFADENNDYFGSDSIYDDNGPSGNTNHFRNYLLRERSDTKYSVLDIDFTIPTNTIPTSLPSPSVGKIQIAIQLTGSTKLEPGDFILLSIEGIDAKPYGYSDNESMLKVVGLASNVTTNDTIIVEVDDQVSLADFGLDVTELELYNSYDRFVQFICEVNGVNNVKLPNRAYTESQAYISNQHGQTPYTLWNVNQTNNYKPNSQWPILPIEIQAEIQGGENVNNPILTNNSNYPGDIWGHFDDEGFLYKSKTGDLVRRYGEYYGVKAVNNINPTLMFPDFDASTTDGLTLNLNINEYAKAVTYVYPIDSFNEFGATAFNNEAPQDFEFNAVLWYYTLEDVSGQNMNSATNLYGVEFLDTPENDIDVLKTKIPTVSKYVSNGYQDGNSFTFTLDINLQIDSGDMVQPFDPEKVYSMFGMELYYEAMTRLTYFNDKITDLINSNLLMKQQVDSLRGLVFNQTTLESIRNRMNNIENLLNIYSTLQIGDSDTIISRLDTSVSPPKVRLTSIDKRYGNVYSYNTKLMYTEFINQNGKTEISTNEEIIPVGEGKDFLVLINNNDNSIPAVAYDESIFFDNLEITFAKDLEYKQSVDVLILPSINDELISPTNITNYPVNDKSLDININFNNNNTIIKHKIGTYSLPVVANYDGTDINMEARVGLEQSPVWQIKDIYISKLNQNLIQFSIYINDDLINNFGTSTQLLGKLSRFYLQNFLLEQVPSTPNNNYFDLSKQYEVYNTTGENPRYIRSNIVGVEIVNSGSGYPASTTAIETNIGGSTVDIEYTTDNAGNIINVQMVSSSLYTTQNEIDINTYIIPGGSGGEIRFIVNPVTRIDFIMDINESTEINNLLSNYINTLALTTIPQNINKYLKLLPQLRLLGGYKINITRVSEQDLTIGEFDKRYKINIDML